MLGKRSASAWQLTVNCVSHRSSAQVVAAPSSSRQVGEPAEALVQPAPAGGAHALVSQTARFATNGLLAKASSRQLEIRGSSTIGIPERTFMLHKLPAW